MKKDRFWLYWGIYAGVILAVNILLVILFPHMLKADIFMIFPFLFLFSMLYNGWSNYGLYKESDIEREFYTRLVKMGVHVKIESNRD